MEKLEFSKSLSKRSKQIDNNIAEAFKAFKEKKAAEEKLLQEQKDAAMYSVAYNSYGAKNDRVRQKEKVLTEKVTYEEKANIAGLTNVLTETVKRSLLLDLDEYKAINENYENFIKETVQSFLEKADLNREITNENTIKLMEFVEENKPSQEVGIYLNEAELYDEFGNKTYEEIDNEINALAGDVMDNVAKLIDDQREASQEVNDNLNAITSMDESARPLLFRNDTQKSVLEVLALNEAKEMVQNGKPYNGDLALANAITYITVLETLDATGFVTVGKEGYRKLLEASGELVTPLRKVASKAPVMTVTETEDLTNKTKDLEAKINEARTVGFVDFKSWKQSKDAYTIHEEVKPETKYDYIDRKGNKMLKEDVRTKLSNEGFDFEIDDFETIASVMGYRKI